MKGAPPRPHVSLLGAWALAFGCALGWDSLVLPWESFLPEAGPLGTVLGLCAGGLAMAVVAWNYHFMMVRHPGPGGVYAYAGAAFGADHGFLCAWFLGLTYVAIVWLDAMVTAYFVQHAWGFDFHFGLHHEIAGHEVCLVHVLLSLAMIAAAAAICCRRRLAGAAQTLLALVFAACVAGIFAAALARHEGGRAALAPAFAPAGGDPAAQIVGIVLLSPWLFVGFESISNSSGEFRFPLRRSFGVMIASIAAAVAAYALLSLVPALVPGLATGAASWPDAVSGLADPDDTAYRAAALCFGRGGLAAVSATFFAAIFTNLVGNTVAASRLFAAMADDGALPRWFGRRNADGAPRNAVLAIALCSPFVFLLGRAVVEIAVNIALVGAALAYAYTSAAAWRTARAEGRRATQATGLLGAVLAGAIVAVYLLPNVASDTATVSTESYLVLVVWCIVGLLAFLNVFRRDDGHRFGRSPVAWLALFATILFLSVSWIRQTTYRAAETAFAGIDGRREAVLADGAPADGALSADARRDGLIGTILRNSMVQAGLTVLSLALMLALMLALYAILRRREREREREKARAQSYFFSTVSHDIRTPLNAIVGFAEMLRDGFKTDAERAQAIDSIITGGQTLLALVNDVLDLSKLEAGKMEISPEPTDVPSLLGGIVETFRVAGAKPGLEVRLRAGGMPALALDPQRLRQVAFNLVGNAVKFTERGHVEVRASFERAPDAETGVFRLDVEDTGCGIPPENLRKIASPWVQVGSKLSRNGGTGLGLAICRQLAAAMGGSLDARSEVGRGSTFSLVLPGVAAVAAPAPAAPPPPPAPARPAGADADAAIRRILVVDDSKVNRLVLCAQLRKRGGFEIETAENGREALERLRAPGETPFDLVFTDFWMPELDGAGLVKAVRADPALAALRIVAVTADIELIGRSADLGFDAFLLKPITAEKLSAILSEAAR